MDLAFSAITAERVDALLSDPGLDLHQQRIVAFAERSGLPAMYGIKEFAASGGLMTYAANMTDQFRRAASYVDKILKGAKRLTYRSNNPQNSSWSSISKLPERSAWNTDTTRHRRRGD